MGESDHSKYQLLMACVECELRSMKSSLLFNRSHWQLKLGSLRKGFTNTLGKGMNPIILPPAMGK